MDRVELYKKAINKWGENSQVEMAIEECSELIQAIQKIKRSDNTETFYNVCEEIADVEIMIEQLRLMFDNNLIDSFKVKKLERLEIRLNK